MDITNNNKEKKEKEAGRNNSDCFICSNKYEATAAAAEDQFSSPVAMDINYEKHKEGGERNNNDINDETTTKPLGTPTIAGEEENQS